MSEEDNVVRASWPAGRIWFKETLVRAEHPRQLLDSDGCTRIVTGEDSPQAYLRNGDIRKVSDDDGRTWIVNVEQGRVTEGFVLDPEFTRGELVICLAEEEGNGSCPLSPVSSSANEVLCRHPRQICRQEDGWTSLRR